MFDEKPYAGNPNIVLLFTDQHRFDALGCAGDPVIQTPQIDALAASGVRFAQACTSSPVCVPARMSLVTGHRSGRTHRALNERDDAPGPELPTLMRILAAAGYRTHACGHLHFGGRHYGLQSIDSLEEMVDVRIDDDYLIYLREKGVRTRHPLGIRDLLYYQPQTSGIPVEHAPSTWVGARSVEFIRNHVRYRGSRPFFLWASWIAPHPPFAPCEPYDSMYDPASMELPFYVDRPTSTLPDPAWTHRARLDGAHRDPDRMRRLRALYYGEISHVDTAVGAVLAELKRLGLWNRTVVIFASDHGEMLGNHGLSQKNVPYEHSIRIPLIIRWPGRTGSGRTSNDLVGLTDILPTLLDGLGIDYPQGYPPLPGASLLADGGGLKDARDFFVIDHGYGPSRWICARGEQLKYAFWAAGGFEELYDLKRDPEERNNLAHRHSETARAFRSIATLWERQHGFRSSLAGEGLKTYPQPDPPAEVPSRIILNQEQWAQRLPGSERASVESFAEAFRRAIEKEARWLNPEKLSLRQYKELGGDLSGTPWEEAWRKA